jgi:hypothetical protein
VKLSYDQTKQLIAKAIAAPNWDVVRDFMGRTLQVKENPEGVYATALNEHAKLLEGLSEKDLLHLYSFISKRRLQGDYPMLYKKLTPNQVKQIGLASYPAVEEILAADPSAQPPKKWWNKMHKEVKEGNPDYSEEKIDKTIGNIWYNDLSDEKRKEIRAREGKHYQAASMLERVLADGELSEERKESQFGNMDVEELKENLISALKMAQQSSSDFIKSDSLKDAYEIKKVLKKHGVNWLDVVRGKLPVKSASDDRKAQPSNDVINEVQPRKWKKAKPGQAQPLNLPMNPNAKDPGEKMEGLPPAIAAVLAGEMIQIPKEEFTKEHKHLLKVLDNPTPEALKKEHDKQKKEAEEEVGLKHVDAAAFKWCGKCVRMTKHEDGECQEH